MLTDNATPFSAIGFEQWHRDGPTMAVVAVRGSFLVGPGGALELAETQQIVLADEFAGDPQKSPLVRLSDLVPFKPGTDVTFLGSAHAPQGQPLASISAALSIAGRRVEICATGPRQWRAVQDSWILSEPEPVDVVPVCYTLASGGRIIGDPEGTVDPRNPIGPGLIDPDVTPRNRDFPAPRLFNSRDPLHDDFARPPRPAGLARWPPGGPRGRTMPEPMTMRGRTRPTRGCRLTLTTAFTIAPIPI